MPKPLSAFLMSTCASGDSVVSQNVDYYAENHEVTEDEHLLNLSSTSDGSERRLGALPRRKLGQIMRLSQVRKPNTRGRCNSAPASHDSELNSHGQLSAALEAASVDLSRLEDASSYAGDAATISGLKSVSTFQTFSSHDTVKASNKKVAPAIPLKPSSESSKGSEQNTPKQKIRWKNIKKAIAVVKSSSLAEGLIRRNSSKENDEHAAEEDPLASRPLQQRSRSTGSQSAAETANLTVLSETAQLDELFRGRLDGLDVLSLGSAFDRILPLPPEMNIKPNTAKAPWDHWMGSAIGSIQKCDPAQMVTDMLRTSAGHSPPDIVLEGFTEADRWSLRIEEGLQNWIDSSNLYPSNPTFAPPPPPVLPATSSSEDDDGSPDMPTRKLWSTLWGTEPAPASSLPTLEEIEKGSAEQETDDPLLDLAAESSVPIDVDEDTFIVSTPEHLDAIHGIASVPISAGRFGSAIRILRKLVLGLDSSTSEAYIKDNLRGCTCHNIGLLYMWQNQYSEALHYFSQAVEAREYCPVASRRDVAVTLVRKGQVLFALHRHREALECFETALKSTDEDQVIRAKILNNVGVAQYYTGELAKALQSFTQALAIQRKWLDGPVRREPLVYDASVTLENMGKLFLERGDNARASFVYEEALLLQKSVFRKEHPLVLKSLCNLAFSKARQSQIPKAIKILERCRRIQVDLYGTAGAPVIETCGWMAHLCAKVKKSAKAQAFYDVVYAWQKVYLPADHPAKKHVLDCLVHLPSPPDAVPPSPGSPTAENWL